MASPAVGPVDWRGFFYSFYNFFTSAALSYGYDSASGYFVFAGGPSGGCRLDYGSKRTDRRCCICKANTLSPAFCFCIIPAVLYVLVCFAFTGKKKFKSAEYFIKKLYPAAYRCSFPSVNFRCPDGGAQSRYRCTHLAGY